jgi:hypothetical protein
MSAITTLHRGEPGVGVEAYGAHERSGETGSGEPEPRRQAEHDGRHAEERRGEREQDGGDGQSDQVGTTETADQQRGQENEIGDLLGRPPESFPRESQALHDVARRDDQEDGQQADDDAAHAPAEASSAPWRI